MYRLKILVLISLVGLTSSFDSEWAKDKKYTLNHDGYERTYLVHLPSGYTPSRNYPLVFALHGGAGRAKVFNRSTNYRFNKLADEEGFILVYPQGVGKSWNDNNKRDTLGRARKLNIDDVGFFKKLITKMELDYSVDNNNIFACGISNGGLMSLTLAHKIPEKIKAIGMVASNFSEEQMKEMKEASPFSMVMINGDEDPIFPYSEGKIRVFNKSRGNVLGTEKSIEFLCVINGNNIVGIESELPNPNERDGCTATQTDYQNPSNPNLKIQLIRVNGGGHTWPGGNQYLPKKLVGRVSKDFNAADLLWQFFKSTMD